MEMKMGHYTIILQPEPEGGFTVTVPALPGCVTFGKDLEEAKRMAEDAVGAYLYSMKQHGEFIPTDHHSFVAAVDVALP